MGLSTGRKGSEGLHWLPGYPRCQPLCLCLPTSAPSPANHANTATVQEKSYFALRLPHGWWVLALDLALVDDIDMCQYR